MNFFFFIEIHSFFKTKQISKGTKYFTIFKSSCRFLHFCYDLVSVNYYGVMCRTKAHLDTVIYTFLTHDNCSKRLIVQKRT